MGGIIEGINVAVTSSVSKNVTKSLSCEISTKCCTRYRGGGVSDSHMKVGVGKFVFNLPIS